MDKYNVIYEALQNKVDTGELTFEDAVILNDMAYNKYFIEAEEDHIEHIARKHKAASDLGVSDSSKLFNKKYKDGNSSKKAMQSDIKYDTKYRKYKDETRRELSGIYHVDDKLKGALRELDMMRKNTDMSDPKQLQRYKVAFNQFCTRFGIDPSSSLWINYHPTANSGKGQIEISYSKEGHKFTKKELHDKSSSKGIRKLLSEKKYILPHGYTLIHRSTIGDITELKPTKAISGRKAEEGGQFHPTGRVYMTLVKDDNTLKSDNDPNSKSYGKYKYKLVDKSVNEFYIDTTITDLRDTEKNGNISKLLNKNVYIKTNRPVKVELVNKDTRKILLSKEDKKKREEDQIKEKLLKDHRAQNKDQIIETYKTMYKSGTNQSALQRYLRSNGITEVPEID